MSKTDTPINKYNADTLDYAELSQYVVNYLKKTFDLQTDTAEDIAQNAFVKMKRHLNMDREIDYPKTWIIKVAHREFLNQARSSASRRVRGASDRELERIESATDDRVLLSGAFLPPSPDDDGVTKYLKKAFSQLSPAFQQSLQTWLQLNEERDELELTGADNPEGKDLSRQLGEHLKIPTGTAKTRLHRAKIAFRQKVEAMYDSDPVAAEIITEALGEMSREPAGASRR